MTDLKSPREVTEIDCYVGNRVKATRQMRFMSQQNLAKRVGVSFQQVQKYEKCVDRITAGRLFRIAGALEVPVGYFFEGLGDVAKPD